MAINAVPIISTPDELRHCFLVDGEADLCPFLYIIYS